MAYANWSDIFGKTSDANQSIFKSTIAGGDNRFKISKNLYLKGWSLSLDPGYPYAQLVKFSGPHFI